MRKDEDSHPLAVQGIQATYELPELGRRRRIALSEPVGLDVLLAVALADEVVELWLQPVHGIDHD